MLEKRRLREKYDRGVGVELGEMEFKGGRGFGIFCVCLVC